jgi:hypothetical protein
VLDAYFARLKALLDRYAATPFVLLVRSDFETRPGGQGYLSGSVLFEDASTLGAWPTTNTSRIRECAPPRQIRAFVARIRGRRTTLPPTRNAPKPIFTVGLLAGVCYTSLDF